MARVGQGSENIGSPLNPFSVQNLANIFRVNSDAPTRIRSRESGWLEFKENFNWASWEKYGRTCAAFANANGGYIVFGIKNRPRELTGMTNTAFEDTTPETISADMNSTFSPEIRWERYVHEADGRKYGLIYVYPCDRKPVIATKNIRGDIKEGEIYYRYRARTERIRYAELHAIIEERQQSQLDKLFDFMSRAARVGVDNAAILDTLQGTISGPGGTLVIDEGLLDKIKFIREGEFREREGEPTLRLVGDVLSVPSGVVQPVRLVDKHVGIRGPDIIQAFLGQERVQAPREFIKQICYETSGYLPVYYFMGLANLSVAQTIELLQNQQSRTQSKNRLLERLSDDSACIRERPSETHPSGVLALQYHRILVDRSVDPDSVPQDEIRFALRAVRMLTCDEIDCTYLFPILFKWFDQHYADSSTDLADALRRAICYLDYYLNHPDDKCRSTNQ